MISAEEVHQVTQSTVGCNTRHVLHGQQPAEKAAARTHTHTVARLISFDLCTHPRSHVMQDDIIMISHNLLV